MERRKTEAVVFGGSRYMKKVLLRAPLLSQSGYGVHSRQILRYLLQAKDVDVKTQIVPWGITPWSVDHNADNGLIGEALSRSIPSVDAGFDVSIQVQLPNEWDASIATKNVGVTAGVETDFSNPTWTSVHCSKMDLVITPSKHTRDSLLRKSFTQTEIKIVPETFFDEILSEPKDLPELDNLTTDFNFLAVGVLTGLSPDNDRKNTLYLIKWFLEEFKDDPDVGLIIKTNRGRETSIDRKLTYDMLRQVLKEVKSGEFPKIHLLHGNMDRKSMNSLYKHKKVKGFLSATRGEGFGLPFIEAAAADLPVLATNWSAHTEFMNLGKWIKFEYDLKEISNDRIDGQIFTPGMKWAEVREADFKKKIRKFRNASSTPKEWAQKTGEVIREKYSWKAICDAYDEALGDLLF